MAKKKSTSRRRSASTVRGKKAGLSSLKMDNYMNDGKKALLLLGGVFLGSQVYALIDKRFGSTVAGLFGPDGKKIIAPAATLLVGLTATQLMAKEEFKFVGYGVAAAGGYQLAKNVFNKDILSGIGDDSPALPGIGLNLPELQAATEVIEGAGAGINSDLSDTEAEDLVIL